MYAESWYKIWCPHCETINWYCNGNEQDLTTLDVDSVRCWKCKEVFNLVDEEDEIFIENYGLQNNLEDGLEKPR